MGSFFFDFGRGQGIGLLARVNHRRTLFYCDWPAAGYRGPRMDPKYLVEGLISYLCFLPVLTFHEFAHAWVAWKCGDDTARMQGRVSLNPAAHIDTLGTIILPLMAVVLGAMHSGLSNFIIGWGKPVPVNVSYMRNPRRDDTLVALAGPGMNILLAVVIMLVARLTTSAHIAYLDEALVRVALMSLFLCYFNLLPVPPLDGSHLMKNLIGMRDETYLRISAFGFLIIIILIQIPLVNQILVMATMHTMNVIMVMLRF
jgi:Zn-dependent protease